MNPVRLFLAFSAALLALAAPSAISQGGYPTKPVRVIVPFPPGGTNDIVARIVARDLGESTGQQFVIDNRGGASGVIGAEAVARSPADGYSIMVHSTTHLTNAFSYKKLPYDTFASFEPITLLAGQPCALVVHPSLPVKSAKDFIALAKSRPNQITYASNGEGGNLHVMMALLASMANIKMIHVPYKGGGPMATSLISGETQSAVATIGSVMVHIKSGRLRPVAVTSATRTKILPDVPPIAETGLPGYDMNPWIGAFAPVKTPKPVLDRLHAELTKVLKKPETAKVMAEQGVEPWPSSPQEFANRMKSDYEKYQKIFKIIGTPATT
jgi:tripartite-type tricarboxylate transporter receptor subunit TctC